MRREEKFGAKCGKQNVRMKNIGNELCLMKSEDEMYGVEKSGAKCGEADVRGQKMGEMWGRNRPGRNIGTNFPGRNVGTECTVSK